MQGWIARRTKSEESKSEEKEDIDVVILVPAIAVKKDRQTDRQEIEVVTEESPVWQKVGEDGVIQKDREGEWI